MIKKKIKKKDNVINFSNYKKFSYRVILLNGEFYAKLTLMLHYQK